jgi:hypothetical protein
MRMFKIFIYNITIVYHITNKAFLDKIVLILSELQGSTFQFHSSLRKIRFGIIIGLK